MGDEPGHVFFGRQDEWFWGCSGGKFVVSMGNPFQIGLVERMVVSEPEMFQDFETLGFEPGLQGFRMGYPCD